MGSIEEIAEEESRQGMCGVKRKVDKLYADLKKKIDNPFWVCINCNGFNYECVEYREK